MEDNSRATTNHGSLAASAGTPSSSNTPLTTAISTAITPTTTTETSGRPLFQNPSKPPNHLPFYPSTTRLPSNPNPNYAQLAPRPPHPQVQDSLHLLYPVASSGRGFLHRNVTVSASRPVSRPSSAFPSAEQSPGNMGFARPAYFMHGQAGSDFSSFPAASTALGVVPGVKGIPVSSSLQPKVDQPNSISGRNGHADSRDKNKGDSLTIIRDRKVRISDNVSLYGLCRSWMRNGCPEDTQQHQYLDAAKSLPRPLPLATQAIEVLDKKSPSDEDDEDDDAVKHLSEAELLQKHVRRAKRVRSRLREARLQRINRYKTRLALLLPPMVEQQFRNETALTNLKASYPAAD